MTFIQVIHWTEQQGRTSGTDDCP